MIFRSRAEHWDECLERPLGKKRMQVQADALESSRDIIELKVDQKTLTSIEWLDHQLSYYKKGSMRDLEGMFLLNPPHMNQNAPEDKWTVIAFSLPRASTEGIVWTLRN